MADLQSGPLVKTRVPGMFPDPLGRQGGRQLPRCSHQIGLHIAVGTCPEGLGVFPPAHPTFHVIGQWVHLLRSGQAMDLEPHAGAWMTAEGYPV